MKAGTVLFFNDFKFYDGTTKDKLIILLNTPKTDEPYLVCLTTSRQWKRKNSLGCHSDNNYYYIDEKQDKFIENTWVVFHNIYEFSHAKILSALLKNNLNDKFDLDINLWSALKNCILKSIDIDQDYLNLIKRG